jgi:acetate kinase
MVERLGTKSTKIKYEENGFEIEEKFTKTLDHKKALELICQVAKQHQFIGIGHRVVHGGDRFQESVRIDEEVRKEIEQLSDLAPLHNPVNLLGIEHLQTLYPGWSFKLALVHTLV